MVDPTTLMTLLTAGGAVAASAMVEEVTKDAWQGMKSAIHELFGRRGTSAVAKLETEEGVEEGRSQLAGLIANISKDEARELEPSVMRLAQALRSDPNAQTVFRRRGINLDLDIAGNIQLESIRGAESMNVRARAGGDFILRELDMAKDDSPGN